MNTTVSDRIAEIDAIMVECRKLTGPCREIDRRIALAIGNFVLEPSPIDGDEPLYCIEVDGAWHRPGQGNDMLVPHYTREFEAIRRAMPGFPWAHIHIHIQPFGPTAVYFFNIKLGRFVDEEASTLPLAMCLAVLQFHRDRLDNRLPALEG